MVHLRARLLALWLLAIFLICLLLATAPPHLAPPHHPARAAHTSLRMQHPSGRHTRASHPQNVASAPAGESRPTRLLDGKGAHGALSGASGTPCVSHRPR